MNSRSKLRGRRADEPKHLFEKLWFYGIESAHCCLCGKSGATVYHYLKKKKNGQSLIAAHPLALATIRTADRMSVPSGTVQLASFPKPSLSRTLLFARRRLADAVGRAGMQRAKRGSKRHLICDGRGIPLAIELTGANCHDSTRRCRCSMPFRPLQGPRGRPRCHPDCILGDRAYDAERIRRAALTSHLSATRDAQYGKRQQFGTMARGHRTYLRVVEPVPSSSPAV
jgi:Transposase DDE domain